MLVIPLKVDEMLQIGDELFVGPTDIDEKFVRLIACGRAMGGEDDGMAVMTTADLGRDGELRLGPQVVVTIVDIWGNKVRLGIQAPKATKVHRTDAIEVLRRYRNTPTS